MHEAGIDPDHWLTRPEFNDAIRNVVARLLAEADALYERSDHGVAKLPWRCRPAIRSARLVYAEIGKQVQRMDFDSVNKRAVVSTQKKIGLIGRASAAAITLPSAGPARTPPLPAIQYLVDAAASRGDSKRDNRNFYDRTVWVIDLFERLTREEQSARLSTD
jgi:phytoene synthase